MNRVMLTYGQITDLSKLKAAHPLTTLLSVLGLFVKSANVNMSLSSIRCDLTRR